MGRRGSTVEDQARFAAVPDEALAVNGPVILQAVVDPNGPLLPAVVSEAYAKHLRQALGEGTEDAAAIKAALGRAPSRSMMGDGHA